jgi:hypothetical protein
MCAAISRKWWSLPDPGLAKGIRLPLHRVNNVRGAVPPNLTLLLAYSVPSNSRLSVEDEDDRAIVSVEADVTINIVGISGRPRRRAIRSVVDRLIGVPGPLTFNHGSDSFPQSIHLEWLGHDLHSGLKMPVVDYGIFRVTGDK